MGQCQCGRSKEDKGLFRNFFQENFYEIFILEHFETNLRPRCRTKKNIISKSTGQSFKKPVCIFHHCIFQPLDLAMQNKYDQTINQHNHADDDNWVPKRPSIRLSLQL